jgi:hypothetical protein
MYRRFYNCEQSVLWLPQTLFILCASVVSAFPTQHGAAAELRGILLTIRS